MAVEQSVIDGVVRWERNDETRKFTVYDGRGRITFQRDYTAQENQEADDRIAINVSENNRNELLTQVGQGIDAMLAQQDEMLRIYTTATNADIAGNLATAASSLKTLMKWQWDANNNLIALARLVAGVLDSTETG